MEEEIKYHTCTKCEEEKLLTTKYFYKKNTKFGFRKNCIKCCNATTRMYRSRPDVKKRHKQQYDEWRKGKGKDWVNNYAKKWYTKSSPEFKKRKSELKNIYIKERKKIDKLFIVSIGIRSLVTNTLKRKKWKKNSKTQKILCCNFQTFKEHIENQFTDGMSWNNRSEWHLDHIYPVSLAQTEEDMYIFNHYTNFQPLWAKDNLSKSNKVPDGFEEWYKMMKEKVDY